MTLNNLPFSIELIFDNFILRSYTLTCILYVFNKNSGISIRELSFYYSLVLSEDFSKFSTDFTPYGEVVHYNIKSLYYQSQKEIKKLVLFNYNNELIDIIKKEKTNLFELSNLYLKINDNGSNLVNSLESKYYLYILDLCKKIKNNITYNVKKEKEIIGI